MRRPVNARAPAKDMPQSEEGRYSGSSEEDIRRGSTECTVQREATGERNLLSILFLSHSVLFAAE